MRFIHSIVWDDANKAFLYPFNFNQKPQQC